MKSHKTFQMYGWFLGGIGIHDLYAGYTKKAAIHAILTRIEMISFAAFFLFADLSNIEDEPFWCLVLLAGFFTFLGNNIWAIVETATIKVDSNNIQMI